MYSDYAGSPPSPVAALFPDSPVMVYRGESPRMYPESELRYTQMAVPEPLPDPVAEGPGGAKEDEPEETSASIGALSPVNIRTDGSSLGDTDTTFPPTAPVAAPKRPLPAQTTFGWKAPRVIIQPAVDTPSPAVPDMPASPRIDTLPTHPQDDGEAEPPSEWSHQSGTSTVTIRTIERAIERLRSSYPVAHTRQVNCLLIGRPGNGKSSLINSLFQALCGRQETLCEEGASDASCTIKYACSPALCTERALPLVLFDTKGLPDAKDRGTRTMLQNLFKGKFKPNHSMNNPRFKDCYMLPQRALQVNVALFVYAYGSVFPHRLASALYSEARDQGITVLPVVTFYDLVEHDDQLEVHLDCCRRTFNTYPIYLTNLSALKHNPQDRNWCHSHKAVLDVASQLMVYGQQHQRFKHLDVSQPLTEGRDCAVM